MSATNRNPRGNQSDTRRAAQLGGGTLTRRQFVAAAGLALGGLAVAGLTPLGVRQAAAAEVLPYYLGEYPSERAMGWTSECQGVTHDSANWFFSQRTALWKIPVGISLDANIQDPSSSFYYHWLGVRRVGMPDELDKLGYNHFGDIDHYGGYLFVPLERHRDSDGSGPILATGIAAFRAGDLSYVAHAPLPDQTSAPWCAIDPASGQLYSSNNTIGKQHRYAVDLAKVQQKRAFLSKIDAATMSDESGSLLSLEHVQGGTFSPDGKRFYLQADGIHVFNYRRRVAHSTNISGTGGFKYEFHDGWPKYEEPEGLTYWDLRGDQRVHETVRGVLHALLLDNEADRNADDICFKHYR